RVAGFQDRCLQPLGHASNAAHYKHPKRACKAPKRVICDEIHFLRIAWLFPLQFLLLKTKISEMAAQNVLLDRK
ncbi:MAG: hypothetical protein ACTMIX_11110, partial [Kluyvera intermedia]